jgi:hypothetical protein
MMDFNFDYYFHFAYVEQLLLFLLRDKSLPNAVIHLVVTTQESWQHHSCFLKTNINFNSLHHLNGFATHDKSKGT